MLSQKNIDKLVMTGLYKHEPDKRYCPKLYWNDLFHCHNWTFKVYHNENTDEWYMLDTYFNEKAIELTDENFNEFQFIFDFNDVIPYSGGDVYDYNESDYWHVPVDSAGLLHGGKCFLRKGAVKNKDLVLTRLEDEIKSLERQLHHKKETYEKAKHDEIDLRYV